MKELLIKSEGIRTNHYVIPPFELREGELLVIYLQSGFHFDEMKTQLTDILTEKAYHKNVKIFKAFTYVEYFKESRFKRIFNPITVLKYLKRNADLKSTMISKIFEIDTFTESDKVRNLSTGQQKRLLLCSVLSKTKNIVFDLRGLGAVEDFKSYEFIKAEIKNNEAGILIDWSNDFKNNCSIFIEMEWLVELEELKKIGNGSVSLSKMY